jgi:hypothetical protein
MIYYLNYGAKGEETVTYTLSNYEALISFMKHHLKNDGKTVYLLTSSDVNKAVVDLVGYDGHGENKEIFITEDINTIRNLIVSQFGQDNFAKCTQIFLFENTSYEDAYRIALDMKEVSSLCYEPEEQN